MCPDASANICGVLKILIEEHHIQFKTLYSAALVIPKFHFLVHYPEQIMRLGPLVRSWNMRNEAKLSLFKRASHFGNFKNSAYFAMNSVPAVSCHHLLSVDQANSLLLMPQNHNLYKIILPQYFQE